METDFLSGAKVHYLFETKTDVNQSKAPPGN